MFAWVLLHDDGDALSKGVYVNGTAIKNDLNVNLTS